VSAGTVRKALDRLEEDRLVVRRQGRGTFVIDQARELADRFSNIRDADGRLIATTARILEQSAAPADEAQQQRLQLSGDEPVLRTRRLRYRDQQPFALEEACLAIGRFPGLDANGVQNYRITTLAPEHGVHLARAEEVVSAAQATKEEAEKLEVDVRAPLLKLDRVLFSMDGQPLEWRVALCRLGESEHYFCEMK
jgi:GntR family transcriptional regulator